MEGLKDIKGLVKVPDNSLWIDIAILLVLTLIISYLIYRYATRLKPTPKPSQKELAKKRLNEVKLDDAKGAVYLVLNDGELFVDEKNRELFEKIKQLSEPYKYKREVPPLSDELKEAIREFVGGIR